MSTGKSRDFTWWRVIGRFEHTDDAFLDTAFSLAIAAPRRLGDLIKPRFSAPDPWKVEINSCFDKGCRGELSFSRLIIAAQGSKGAQGLFALVADTNTPIPEAVRSALLQLTRQLERLDEEIAQFDEAIQIRARTDQRARRLIGPITASAVAASVQDVSAISGPREFAAFLGLAPRQNSSGDKERLGRVSKMCNRYLRKLLVVGAHAVLYHRKRHEDVLRVWANRLIDTKPFRLVAVALANKLARIAFAIMRDRSLYGQATVS